MYGHKSKDCFSVYILIILSEYFSNSIQEFLITEGMQVETYVAKNFTELLL